MKLRYLADPEREERTQEAVAQVLAAVERAITEREAR
jgi:hypothetical protein